MKRVLGAIFAVSIILAASGTAMAAGKPIVNFKTNMGDFTVQLEPERAPKTVANFLEYVRDGHYDGTIFHRVIKNFMIQGGCPMGSGMGGPMYQFEDECTSKLRHDGPGILSMANSGMGMTGEKSGKK